MTMYPLRVAFVNATSRWGGVKSWMVQFAAALAQRGHVVRVYGRQPEFVSMAHEHVKHGELMRFGADCNPMAVARFIKRFRRDNIQVVVLNVGKDLATAGIAARLLGLPVIQRIGLPNDIPLRTKTRLLHKWIQPHFLCPCQFIAEGFAHSLPYLNDADIRVILNGKMPTTHVLHTHQPRRLVMTQQLFPNKEHAAVLHALARLATEETRPWQLDVVGTGQSEGELKALAKHLGIEQRVIWHGFSNDVAGYLREADIFILASTSEGLPNTLLEALANGLLPVTRNVGGVREVLPPHVEPWLLPFTADSQMLGNSLASALALPDDELLQLREQTRAFARDHLHIEQRVDELEFWLRSIAKR